MATWLRAGEVFANITKAADGGAVEGRASRWGDTYNQDLDLDRLAHEGALFMSQNATAGTGIAQTANTTADVTKPFIMGIVPASAVKSVHLVKLVMRPTAVASGQTTQNIDVITSTGLTRTSAGTDYLVSNASGIATAGYRQPRTGLANSSVMSALYVGVPVAVVGTTPRVLAHFLPRINTIPVAGDEYHMLFGSKARGGEAVNGLMPVSTTVNYYARQFSPVIVDPGDGFEVIPWAASIGSAMSWEFELWWYER